MAGEIMTVYVIRRQSDGLYRGRNYSGSTVWTADGYFIYWNEDAKETKVIASYYPGATVEPAEYVVSTGRLLVGVET
jgi:hypothetical protein